MKTYHLFHAVNSPDLRCFTDEPSGAKLPAELGPWSLAQVIGPEEEWTPAISRAVVAAGIIANGFYLWGPVDRPAESHQLIESDRVEGTGVFDRNNDRIGTIKRLFIEKVSGRVLYVDVTFGGFLGMGRHHTTIPWENLSYDKELEGYHTDVTEAQVQGAPNFQSHEVLSDRERQRELRDYWHDLPRGPI